MSHSESKKVRRELRKKFKIESSALLKGIQEVVVQEPWQVRLSMAISLLRGKSFLNHLIPKENQDEKH